MLLNQNLKRHIDQTNRKRKYNFLSDIKSESKYPRVPETPNSDISLLESQQKQEHYKTLKNHQSMQVGKEKRESEYDSLHRDNFGFQDSTLQKICSNSICLLLFLDKQRN